MIRISNKLKYMFENMPFAYVEEDGIVARLDRLVYSSFKPDNIKGLEEDDWDLIHLDGSFKNNALDNLELVVFSDEENTDKFKLEIKKLKEEIILKDKHIKKLTFESNAKDGKVQNMNNQVLYEQKRVKELNKEIRKQENEIRRLMAILDSRTFM